jgi:hypothetical protein
MLVVFAAGSGAAKYKFIGRGAREAEGDGLLNRCTVTVPGVRIPPSPNEKSKK